MSRPSDRAEASSNPPRQKESTGRKDPLEVERRQLSRVAHPVICNDRSAGVADESLNREDQNENVIDFTDKWNEVRDEIDRHQYVGDRTSEDQLVDVRHARIGHETVKKPQKVRDLADRGDNSAFRSSSGRTLELDFAREGPRSTPSGACRSARAT
jgi:hypothetical protein